MVWFFVGLFLGLIILILYSCRVASSRSSRFNEELEREFKVNSLLYGRDKVTLEDCMEMCDTYNKKSLIENGELVGFIQE